MNYPALLVSVILLQPVVAASATSPSDGEVGAPRPSAAITVVWHLQAADDGREDSLHPDVPVNPASVTKAATSLWALERLGPARRFETGFGVTGNLDPATGKLAGDLLVVGGDDPDFHVENAYLVAQALNRAGVREVGGRLLVDDAFWIGWEGGSERREPVASRRVQVMAQRLRDAFDPDRWDPDTRRSIDAFRRRRGIEGAALPRITFSQGTGNRAAATPVRFLVTHRSNELVSTLKRFNAYSNNDIERLGPVLGSAQDLTEFLKPRLSDGRLRFETLSGLGSNRMTPRQIVELLIQLRDRCTQAGLTLGDLLPVVGCDAGTLERFELLASDATGAVTAKTGTLLETDGGVSLLAGLAQAQAGEFFFVVATPQIGGRLKRARGAQQRWLIERITARGGAVQAGCAAAIEFSDSGVEIVTTASD